MTRPSDDGRNTSTRSSTGDAPEGNDEGLRWTGYWKVLRWDGQPPVVPTYYVATPECWEVVKIADDDPATAPHPILEATRDTIVLKDEGADDTDRERWRVDVSDDRLTVTALTGPHDGAVGVAERIYTNPLEAANNG